MSFQTVVNYLSLSLSLLASNGPLAPQFTSHCRDYDRPSYPRAPSTQQRCSLAALAAVKELTVVKAVLETLRDKVSADGTADAVLLSCCRLPEM